MLKYLIFLAPLSLFAQSIVQHPSPNSNFLDFISATYTQNVTAGNLLVAFVFNNQAGQTNAVSDSLNQAWVKVTGDNVLYSTDVWYVANTLGGPDTVTATLPNSTSSTLFIVEVSGVAGSSPLDIAASSHGFSGNPSQSLTTTIDGDFIFGALFLGNGLGSAGTRFTGIDSTGYDVDEWTTQTSAGLISVGFTNGDINSGGWVALAAAFKSNTPPPPPPPSVPNKPLTQTTAFAPFYCEGFSAGKGVSISCYYPDGSWGSVILLINASTQTATGSFTTGAHTCLIGANVGSIAATIGTLGSVPPASFAYNCTP